MGSGGGRLPAGDRGHPSSRAGAQQPRTDSRAPARLRSGSGRVPPRCRESAGVQDREVQSGPHADRAGPDGRSDWRARTADRAARRRDAALSVRDRHRAYAGRTSRRGDQVGDRREAACPAVRADGACRCHRSRSRETKMSVTIHHEGSKSRSPICTRGFSRLRGSFRLREKTWLGAVSTTLAGSIIASGAGARAPATPIFVESAATTGLTFTHVNGATGNYYLPEVMGGGVALFDYDNDGDLDVFLVQGGPLGALAKPGAPTATCRLFRNDLTVGAGGRRTLRFTDVTEKAGVGLRGYGMGAAVGDYDNDGFPDLFVTSFGSTTLFHNNGDGTFTDVTEKAGVADSGWSTSAAFFDYDPDGYLDLFVAHYVDFTTAANKLCNDPAGAGGYCSPRAFRPVPARPFPQRGPGHCRD